MKNPTIDKNLAFARQALGNAIASAAIRDAIAEFGYDEKRMQEGQALYERANNLVIEQIREYAEQHGATKDLKNIYEKASQVYMTHVKIARIALRNDSDYDLYQSLRLKGERQKSYDGWFAQANAFYTIALKNAKIQTAMAYLGIDKKKLEEGHSLIKEFQRHVLQRGVEVGDAQKATLMRDEAIEELDRWISDFISISRIALEDDPQELEKLGIVMH
jgi:hypothetical protein